MTEHIKDLVAANRILAHEGVVDGYGHVSVRNPEAPDRFFMSRSRSPELVALGDILEFGLDGEAAAPNPPPVYGERFIHAAIYEARPDVQAVVHSHSYDVIPFSVTGIPLRPIFHSASRIGGDVPVWNIARRFGDTNLLVNDMDKGRDLAKTARRQPRRADARPRRDGHRRHAPVCGHDGDLCAGERAAAVDRDADGSGRLSQPRRDGDCRRHRGQGPPRGRSNLGVLQAARRLRGYLGGAVAGWRAAQSGN